MIDAIRRQAKSSADRDALRVREEMKKKPTRWRSMKTAPRDSTTILVCWDEDELMACAYWHKKKWYLDLPFKRISSFGEPTHWRPLPKGPSGWKP